MSIDPNTDKLTSIGNNFAVAMGSFVETDFQYFGYLRNRQRFYIGSKNISTTSNVTPTKKIVEEPNTKTSNRGRKPPKNPFGVPVPITIPPFAFGKQKTEENYDKVPDAANDIKVTGGIKVPDVVTSPPIGDVYGDFFDENPVGDTPYPDYNKLPDPQPPSIDWAKVLDDTARNILAPITFGISAFKLFGSGLGIGNQFATGGYVTSATPALIGEAGPELVIPVAKFGEAIESMYREGASVMIASTIGFLNKLPNSSARAGVMAEANSLASIFGISDVATVEGNFGLTKPLKPFEGTGGVTALIAGAPAEPKRQNARGGGGLLGMLNMGRKVLRKTKIGKKVGKVARRSKTVAKGLLKKAGRKIGVKSVAKIGGKALGKGLLKKIPFLGLGAGLLFAGQRMMAGDFKGAGLEMLSGVAGTVPGIGTAVSVGLDAALAAKDVGMMGDGKPEPSTPNPNVAGNGAPIILNPSTMKAWERAVNAAAKDGVNLPMSVTSSFRSAKQQQELIDRAAAGDPNVMTPAPVGLSPHGQGWAIDINYYSKANEWMRENGSKYGFKWQGDKDPVHFDFWNNEPNDKWLQPGNRKWIPNNIAAPEKKNSSQITNPNIKQPNVSSAKNILGQEPVKQLEKQTGVGDNIAQMRIPVPIETFVPYPVPTEVNKDSKDYVVIDVFGKGSKREVVS